MTVLYPELQEAYHRGQHGLSYVENSLDGAEALEKWWLMNENVVTAFHMPPSLSHRPRQEPPHPGHRLSSLFFPEPAALSQTLGVKIVRDKILPISVSEDLYRKPTEDQAGPMTWSASRASFSAQFGCVQGSMCDSHCGQFVVSLLPLQESARSNWDPVSR